MPVTLQDSYVSQAFMLGLESTYATEVQALKVLKSIKAPFAPMYETERFRASGDMVASVNTVNDEYTSINATGKPDYNAITYFAASVWGEVSPTGPTDSAYDWQFNWNGKVPSTPASFTAIYGTKSLARQAAGVVWTRYGFSISRGGVDFTAAAFGKKATRGIKAYPRESVFTLTITATGGTYDLVWSGQTAGSIAYNADAATILAALEALSNVAPGDVSVTGTGPYVISALAGGAFEATDVTASVVTTSLTGGSATLTETQQGGDTTAVPAKVMMPLHFSIYADAAYGNVGTTKLLYCYDWSLDVPERYARTRPINASKSSDGVAEPEDQAITVKMTLGVDATSEGFLDTLEAGSTTWFRLIAEGGLIGATSRYTYRHDLCLFITEADGYQASDAVHVLPITGELALDPANDKASELLVRNTLAEL